MAKKNFTPNFNELLGITAAAGTSTAPTETKKDNDAGEQSKARTNAEAPTPCCSFRIEADTLKRLHVAAYSETGKQGKRVTITNILTEALQDYFEKKGY